MLASSRLLVTGADGFVGRHLLVQLRESFPRSTLIATIRPAENATELLKRADSVVALDLLEPESCADVIAKACPDGLIHLAAQASVATSFADPLANWRANVLGTVALAEAVLRHAAHCRFVLASSAEIYGLSFRTPSPLDEAAPLSPVNPYAASKAAADLAIGEMSMRGLNSVRLRAFNQTGSGQSDRFVIANFACQIARIEAGIQESVMEVGALDRWRDFVDVRDVCLAYVAALDDGVQPGSIYNIASGIPRRIGDILQSLISRSRLTPSIKVAALRLRPTDVERIAGDSARAHRDLNWVPVVPWDETLDVVLSDWRSRV